MNDQLTKVDDIKRNITDFVKTRNWTEAHSPKNLAMSIAIESAELMEIFQWLSTEDAHNIKDREAEYNHLKEELADVLIYCFSMANRLDMDISTIIEEKTKKNGEKYPVKKSLENPLGKIK